MHVINTYKIRTSLIFILFCILYAYAWFTLFIVQIRQHTFFTQLGNKQYYVTRTIQPPRSTIYDRHGTILAMNKDMLSTFILPRQLKDPAQLKKFLAAHFPDALTRLEQAQDRYFIYVHRHITPAQEKLIKQKNIVDINFIQEPGRFYPLVGIGPILGITDQDNQGIMGIELQYNQQLAGSPCIVSLQKDARSGLFYFEQETQQEGICGTPVQLTIDSTLQYISYQAVKKTVESFGAQEGAALIFNPINGEILAMARYPDFDPNNRAHMNMERTKNSLITDTYELGSVIKACAALGILEEEAAIPDELIDCENKATTMIDGIRVNTTDKSVAGEITFAQVIQKSNNIGMAKFTKRIGPKLYDHYQRMGFGTKTGIAFPGEQSGFINPPATQNRQSIFSLSYGYEMNLTLLQLARFFGMLSTGYLVTPTLLLNQESKKIDAGYSTRARDQLLAILEDTVNQGTAYRARIPGYTIRVKTGTANLIDANGLYNHDRNIFTAAGIIEKGDYKRIIVTFVKEVKQRNMYASQVAVPLLANIAERMLIHDRII